jgi:hypothetical protein
MRNPLGDRAGRRTRQRGKAADPSDARDGGRDSDAGRVLGGDSGRHGRDYEAGRSDRDNEHGRRGRDNDGGRAGRNGGAGRGRADGPGDQSGAGSVFVPGYGASQPESPDRSATGGRSSGSTGWYGSAAGGAAGKGPVRGYPPTPGQPPPMYPPGEFAAWNRGPGRAGESRPVPGSPGGSQPGRARSGPHTGPLATGAVPSGGAGPEHPGPPGASGRVARDVAASAAGRPEFAPPTWQAGAADSPEAKSRYYPQDTGSDAEPGYSMLAVSDPAADVTSTQTWQAAGDGRATGIWTAPARFGSGPEADPDLGDRGPAMPDARSMPERERYSDREETAAGPGRRDSAGHQRAAAAQAGTASGLAGDRAAEPGRRTGHGHSGAHTSPHQLPRDRRRGRADEAKRPAGTKPRRKHPASVKVAMATALVLVLAAAAALSYAVLRGSGTPKAGAAAGKSATTSVSAAASPSLGPYGHISSRKTDPTPLTVAQLFPATFTVGGTSVVQTATASNKNCTAQLVGSGIQGAIGSAGCSQVIRATYLSSSQGLMGTIGVLNLSTANGAATAVRSADASDFISQLTAKNGPTSKIGQGTGIEEAAAKGHYLILIWAEFTSLRKPRTSAGRAMIEQFMTELLENTANVSLANRFMSGAP